MTDGFYIKSSKGIVRTSFLIEIKSSYTYNYNIDKNLSKEKYSKLTLKIY
jgi:hypothetical protein